MKTIKIMFASILILYILYCNLITDRESFISIVYLLFSILFIVFICLRFLKINLFIIFLLWILFNQFPFIQSAFKKDLCLDIGYCKEGLTINIEGKQITVNKETCIENKGHWIEDKHCCRF